MNVWWYEFTLLIPVLVASEIIEALMVGGLVAPPAQDRLRQSSVHCRKFLMTMFFGNRSDISADGIIVMRYGGFGNNLHQMLNAVLYGRILQMVVISVPMGFLFLNRSFTTTEGIRVLVGTYEDILRPVRLYGFSDRNSGCFRHNKFLLASTFRRVVVEQFPLSLANQSNLYEHVRSGDIFKGSAAWARGSYAQPPCAYYMDAARIDGCQPSNAIVISWDTANPCVGVLVAAGFGYRKQELFFDIGAMLRAARFVMASGSLGPAIIYLSLAKKNFYTFGCAGWPGLGPHMVCDPSRGYFNGLRRLDWRSIMLHSRCAGWRRVLN